MYILKKVLKSFSNIFQGEVVFCELNQNTSAYMYIKLQKH